jgi:hypothetical protein
MHPHFGSSSPKGHTVPRNNTKPVAEPKSPQEPRKSQLAGLVVKQKKENMNRYGVPLALPVNKKRAGEESYIATGVVTGSSGGAGELARR